MTQPVQQGMTAEQYATAQAVITEQLAANVAAITQLFRNAPMTSVDWDRFLDLLYPLVEQARIDSAELGRSYFDSEFIRFHPGFTPPQFLRPHYTRQWFKEEMFPAKQEFIQPGASDHAVSMVVLRTMKAVENAGRRSVIRGIESTPERFGVRGWARVATGEETCAFCWMLVSRGPVYESAQSAGLDADDIRAKELFQKAESGDISSQEALGELMTRWHPGCDCKVVPVFDRQNWPGIEAYKRTLAVWNKTTRGFSGKDKMNAFRRAIERGDVDASVVSIAA